MCGSGAWFMFYSVVLDVICSPAVILMRKRAGCFALTVKA